MNAITIPRPDDWHLHLGTGPVLRKVAPLVARYFARALVMPDVSPSILTAEDVELHRQDILRASDLGGFQPLMTIKLTPATTPRIIREAAAAGAIAAKLYPNGFSAHSPDGLGCFESLRPVFVEMQKVGMVLCLHGELPDVFVLDREQAFLEVFKEIVVDFPALRIVLEHITTAAAVKRIEQLPDRVAATITVHHLLLTLDDVIGDALLPHHFCRPIVKTPEDRHALIQAATRGNHKFFLGTDSAPHLRPAKESSRIPAGVFTTPVALPLLVELFETVGALSKLALFTSIFGAGFYGLPPSSDTLTLVRRAWQVPNHYSGIVPFRAGERLIWRVAE